MATDSFAQVATYADLRISTSDVRDFSEGASTTRSFGWTLARARTTRVHRERGHDPRRL